MKIKNLTILSILSLSLITGCNNSEKIDENIVSNNNKQMEHTPTKKVEEPIKTKTIEEKRVEQPKTQEKKVQPQQKVFNFNLRTAEGKKITVVVDMDKGWKFGDIKNKVVLLDFFGTWCPPCKAEIPHLNKIREKLGKDFEILGIDIGKRDGSVNSDQTLIDFADTFDIDYPIVLGGDNGQLFGAVSSLNPQGSIPFMVLFSKSGQYLKYYIGMTPEEMLMSDIKQAIKMK